MSSLFAFCVFIGLQTMSEPVQADFQITIPEKIGSTIDKDFESQVFYKILIEGKTYTVNLTQKVYGYNSSEIMKPLIQKFQNLCNYQGHVEGFPNSAVTISTCFGLRGLIQFENVSYGIEPIETSIGFEHIIYPIKNKNTSYTLYTKMNNEQTQLSHKIPRAIKLQLYSTAPYNRYIELHVVVEKKMFDHMGANTATVSQKAFQVIGLASAMLNSLNITLILSSLELWISDNRISVNGEADELLYRFLKWKNTYLVLRPHDVALLLVHGTANCKVVCSNFRATLRGKDAVFCPRKDLWTWKCGCCESDQLNSTRYREKSNYVGATLKGIMCDIKNSGGIVLEGIHIYETTVKDCLAMPTQVYAYVMSSSKYSRAISLEALALIITQLLSLGMGIAFDDHKCRCTGAVCVMSPKAIHFSGVKPFSSCSLEDFTLFISKPNSHCLHNQPHLDPSYKVSICGDKRVDDGEQCDCGGVEECRRDPCCEYKTCRFKQNALCAHGPCCTQCQLRAKGEICRLPEDECDLPEYCNGSSNFCPENFYLHDGYRCNMNKWVCLKGKCRDGTKVCEEVFGQGTQYGSQACFEELNSRNDQFGNCGLSPRGFIPCTFADLRCGKLMCIYKSEFPLSKEDASILYAGVEGDICVSLYFPYRHENYSHMWVPSGTVCGDSKICMANKCVEDKLLPIECTSTKCNLQGRCNNKRNCHCEDYFLPPDCLTTSNAWPGGSVDSGNFPPNPQIRYKEHFFDFQSIQWSILFPAGLFIILCVLVILFLKVTPLRKKRRTAKSTSDEQQKSEDVSQE